MRCSPLTGIMFAFISTGILWPSNEFLKYSFISDCRAETSAIHLTAEKPDSEHSWEQELIALINKDRVGNNLPPLVLDESLMHLAWEHSKEMVNQAIVSHDQPSGDLQVRMNRAGYLFEAARENIAQSRSILQAHAGFLKSETHKKNILAKDVTHIGIGVVRHPYPSDAYLTITEIFAAPRELYPPSAIQDMLIDQIKDLQNRGAVNTIQDPLLDKLASHSLVSLQVPYNRESLKTLLSKSAHEIIEAGNPKLSKLEVVVQVLRNPKDISITASNHHGENLMYGSAVRQIKDIRNQPAFLVMTLLSVSR
jgi:hypothetical protein